MQHVLQLTIEPDSPVTNQRDYRLTLEVNPADPPLRASSSLSRTPGMEADLARLAAAGAGAAAHTRLGRTLFRFLFPGALGDAYFRGKALALGDQRSVQLRLCLNPESVPELLDLPWELIHDGDEAPLLAHRLQVVRVPAPSPARDLVIESLRILVVISDPVNLDEAALLDTHVEAELLLQAVRGATADSGVELKFLPAATLEFLGRTLAEWRPNVLHFVGHGAFDRVRRRGSLQMEDEQGDAVDVPAEALADLLAAHPSLALVFLNACETAASSPEGMTALAWRLAQRGCPATVAMRVPVADPAAIAFSDAFYRTVVAGRPLLECVSAGRAAVSRVPGGDPLWCATPVLLQAAPGEIRARSRALPDDAGARDERTGIVYPVRAVNELVRVLRDDGVRVVFLTGLSGMGKSVLAGLVETTLLQRGIFAAAHTLEPREGESAARVLERACACAPGTLLRLRLPGGGGAGEDFAGLAEALPAGVKLLAEGHVRPPYPPGTVLVSVPELRGPSAVALAGQLLDDPSGRLAEALVSVTGGIPALLRATAARVPAGWPLDRSTAHRLVDGGLAELGIARLLAELPPEQRRVLGWLAVFRQQIVPELFASHAAARTGISEDAVLGAIAQCEAAGWLTHPRLSRRSTVNVPTAIRRLVLDGAADEELRTGHRIAGDHWSALTRHMDREWVAREAAVHYERAGERELEWVMRMLIVENALALSPHLALREGEELLDRVDDLDDSLKALFTVQVRVSMASAYGALGDQEQRRQQLELAAAAYQRRVHGGPAGRERRQLDLLYADALLGIDEVDGILDQPGRPWAAGNRPADPLAEALRLYTLRGDEPGMARVTIVMAARVGEHAPGDLCETRLPEVCGLAGRTGDARVLANAHALLGRHFTGLEEVDRALEHLERALDAAYAGGDENAVVQTMLLTVAALMERQAHASRAWALLERAESLCRKNDNLPLLLSVLQSKLQLHLKHGEIPHAVRYAVRALQLARTLGDAGRMETLTAFLRKVGPEVFRLGCVFLKESELDTAADYFAGALAAATAVGDEVRRDVCELHLGIVLQEQGKCDEALETFRRVQARGRARGDWVVITDCAHEIGQTLVHLGDLEGAREQMEQAVRDKRLHRGGESVMDSLHGLAIIHLQQGDAQRAYEAFGTCARESRAQGDEQGFTISLAQQAMAAHSLGRLDDARRLAAEALALSRSYHIARCEMGALVILGEVALQEGDRAAALEHWTQARHVARDIGARELGELEQRIASLES